MMIGRTLCALLLRYKDMNALDESHMLHRITAVDNTLGTAIRTGYQEEASRFRGAVAEQLVFNLLSKSVRDTLKCVWLQGAKGATDTANVQGSRRHNVDVVQVVSASRHVNAVQCKANPSTLSNDEQVKRQLEYTLLFKRVIEERDWSVEASIFTFAVLSNDVVVDRSRVWLAANWPQIRLIDIEMLASQRGPFQHMKPSLSARSGRRARPPKRSRS